MDFIAKVVNGTLPGTAPISTVQVCYLQYVDDERMCSGPKMTTLYEVGLTKINKLQAKANEKYEIAKRRKSSIDDDDMWLCLKERESVSKKDKSFIELELWHYRIFSHVLGKTAPYESNNTNELTVWEWKLQSSVRDAFIFNRIQFDVLTVIIENETEHWFGIKTASYPVFTYQRSRPRSRPLMAFECNQLPQSPIISAANNPNHKSKCDDCGECNQITMPMETYSFRRTCKNPTDKPAEQAEECTEIIKPLFSFKNIFK